MSGPIAAGAEEPDASPFGEFAESEAGAFADGGWLFLEPPDAPESVEAADDAPTNILPVGPEIVSDIKLRNCDSSPELSVAYTVTSTEGLQEAWLMGTIGEKWFDRSVEVDPTDKTASFTEVFDLTDLKNDKMSRNSVWIMLEVMGTAWEGGFDSIDIEVDFTECTFQDYVYEPEPEIGSPEIIPDSIALSGCATAPELAATYTVRDSDGIARVNFQPSPLSDKVDIDAGSVEVTFTKTVDLTAMKDRQVDSILLYTEAVGSLGMWNTHAQLIIVDFDSCNYSIDESYDGIYDGRYDDYLHEGDEESGPDEGPEIIYESVALSECATNPKLTARYEVRDLDGLDDVTVVSDLSDTTLDLEGGERQLSFAEVIDVRSMKADNIVEINIIVDATNTRGEWNTSYKGFALNFESCTVYDLSFPIFNDRWSTPSEDAPEIVLESFTLSECAASPKLTNTYTVRDSDGIAEVDVQADASYTSHDIDVGSKELSVTEVVDLERWKATNSSEINVNLIAVDLLGGENSLYEGFVLDFESCTVQYYDDAYGDGRYEPPELHGPVIEFSDFTLDNCDATPELSFSYSISDELGIKQINTYASIYGRSIDLPAPSGETEFSGRASFVVDLTYYDEDANIEFEVYNGQDDLAWGVQAFTLDLYSCSVELTDFWQFN